MVNPTTATRLPLLAIGLVGLVGVIDATRDRSWDTGGLFAAVVVLALVLVARSSVHRPLVPLRADLVRWLRTRSEITGEPFDRVADRAVSTYRRQLGEAATQPDSEPDSGTEPDTATEGADPAEVER